MKRLILLIAVASLTLLSACAGTTRYESTTRYVETQPTHTEVYEVDEYEDVYVEPRRTRTVYVTDTHSTVPRRYYSTDYPRTRTTTTTTVVRDGHSRRTRGHNDYGNRTRTVNRTRTTNRTRTNGHGNRGRTVTTTTNTRSRNNGSRTNRTRTTRTTRTNTGTRSNRGNTGTRTTRTTRTNTGTRSNRGNNGTRTTRTNTGTRSNRGNNGTRSNRGNGKKTVGTSRDRAPRTNPANYGPQRTTNTFTGAKNAGNTRGQTRAMPAGVYNATAPRPSRAMNRGRKNNAPKARHSGNIVPVDNSYSMSGVSKDSRTLNMGRTTQGSSVNKQSRGKTTKQKGRARSKTRASRSGRKGRTTKR